MSAWTVAASPAGGRLRAVALAGLLGVLAVLPAATSSASPAGPARALNPAQACTNTAVLDTWSLQRLANETIVFPVEETDVSAASQAARDGYGGIILYGSSAPSDIASQLAALRSEVPKHLGLLVMTDEEGGGVQRMANLVGSMPWAAQMGKTMTPPQIATLARSVAEKMAQYGVNMDLAPVVDVDGRAVEPGAQDPDGFRSFSGNTSVVSADGVAFMEGMRAGGVVPVVKHFPGLGGVSQNTDDGPANTLPWSTLQRVALPPFEAAIRAGAPAIMVSNAMVPGFTSSPASLSQTMVTGELRGVLGFKGLIVTDSLSAGAITALSLSVPQASVDALEAGNDMVLYGSSGSTNGDLSIAAQTSNAIVAAVEGDSLTRTALVSAAAQVMTAKRINLCTAALGYWLVSARGNVYNLGNAGFFGSEAAKPLPAPITGVAPALDGRGYWLVSSRGNVYNLGDAGFYGSEAAHSLPAPIAGLAPTPHGGGYWLVSSRGNVYNLGNATFFGSEAAKSLPAPIVALAPTPDGGGYWLVGSSGAVYPFGDAGNYGSESGHFLPAKIVGMAPTPSGHGYWLVSAKGNVYNLGNAAFYGSEATKSLPAPIVGLAPTQGGGGYWLVSSKGNVYNFGGAAFYGSEAVHHLPAPVVGLVPD